MKSKPTNSTLLKDISNICTTIYKGGSLSKRGVGDDWDGGGIQESMLKVKIQSEVDTWIAPLQPVKIEVQYPGTRIKLNEDQVDGISSLELGTKGDPRDNPGKSNSKIFNISKSDISPLSFQGSPAVFWCFGAT